MRSMFGEKFIQSEVRRATLLLTSFFFLLTSACSPDPNERKNYGAVNNMISSLNLVDSSDPAEAAQKQQAISQIMTLETQIAKQATTQEDAQNRMFKLTSELESNNLIGCHANEPINDFKINVTGSYIPHQTLGSFSSQMTNVGDPNSVNFEFGTAIKIAVDGSKQAVVGTPIEKDLNNQSVMGDIQYIKVSKAGVGYQNLENCKSDGILASIFSGETCTYNVEELNVYSISAIEVYANSYLIYSRNGLKIILDSQTMNQPFNDNIKSNVAWIKLMQQTDCNATH